MSNPPPPKLPDPDVKRLRSIPLETVAAALGGTRDPRDGALWTLPERGVFLLRDDRYMEVATRGYGRGAIDLVLKLRGCRFSEALELLGRIESGKTGEALNSSTLGPRDVRPKTLKLPPLLQKNLPGVIHPLIAHRKISPAVVDDLVQRKRLYADVHGNMVLIMRDPAGSTVGAEIHSVNSLKTVSTAEKGQDFRFAHGTSRGRGAFFVEARKAAVGEGQPSRVFLVSNGIEAMALATMKPSDLIISLGDYVNSGLMDWFGQKLREAGADTYVALPANAAGREAAESFLDRYGFSHFSPASANPEHAEQSWSAVLIGLAAAKDRMSGPMPMPTEQQLRDGMPPKAMSASPVIPEDLAQDDHMPSFGGMG